MTQGLGTGAAQTHGVGQPYDVGQLGEFGMIEDMVGCFEMRGPVLLGPGDDAAVIAVSTGSVVASVDSMIERRHFRTDWSIASDIGHKAAARSLADIAAMGGRTTALLVALGVPAGTPTAWVRDLARGLDDEAALVGAAIVGGDTTAADVITIGVTALGECPAGVAPVTRAGARVGDVVALAGATGLADAGLRALTRGFRSPRAAVDAHRRPRPPYEAGPAAALAGATAMIDTSDGLLADLGHICERSQVGIDIDSERVPVPDAVVQVASAMHLDPLMSVLTGGDDHALVATFPREVLLPPGFRRIGDVVEGSAVTVDGRPWAGTAGHEHFR